MKQRYADIEVFVLTWNRLPLLRIAVESVLAQTLQPKRIVIVDNASDDGTYDYAKELEMRFPHVEAYRQAVHVDARRNILAAVGMVKCDHFMMMHDDDVLARDFISYVDAILARVSNVTMLSTKCVQFSGNNVPDSDMFAEVEYEVYPSKVEFCMADFATFLRHQADSLCFPAVVYNRDSVSTTVLEGDRFGKMFDRPFVYDSCGDGRIVLVKAPLYGYRLHGGQDSATSSNGPYPSDILDMMETQMRLVSQNPDWGDAYRDLSIRLLKSLYRWGGNPAGGWPDFVREAKSRLITSSSFLRPWRIPFWSNYSNLLCKKVLRNAKKAVTTYTVDRKVIVIRGAESDTV